MEVVEIWKYVKNYERLVLVSNLGKIHFLPRVWINGNGRICKHNGMLTFGYKTKKGYRQVGLRKDGVEKKFLVHRLVAEAFVENELGYNQVDHINGNKEDNSFYNLRWCNNIMNCNYDNKKSKIKKTSKKVGVIFNKKQNKWQSYIRFNGKNKHLGFFNTEEEAIQKRINAEFFIFDNKITNYGS